jgi:hypothetical protein
MGVCWRMAFGLVAEIRARFREMPLKQLLTTHHIERDYVTQGA